MLEVKDLSICRKKNPVLNEVSINLERGEIVGLVGPNGAGKSTLIKACSGVIKAKRGQIICDNIEIKDDIEKYLNNIQTCFDRAPFYPHLSGVENLMQVARVYGIDKEEVKEALKAVGLEKRGKEPISKYSFGMKQRLNIAQILMTKKPYILLDEPLNGIDPEGVTVFRRIFLEMREKQGCGILISSHLLGELKNICDRIVFLKNGSIVEEVSLKNSDQVSHVIRVNAVDKAYELIKDNGKVSITADAKLLIDGDETVLNSCMNMLLQNNISILGMETYNDVERIYINKVGGELDD